MNTCLHAIIPALLLSAVVSPSFANECSTPFNPQVPKQLDGITPWQDGSGGFIANLCELRWLSEQGKQAWDEDWRQSADIDASDTKNWNNGEGFKPIAPVYYANDTGFSGSYDGQGYAIRNLTINRPDEHDIGLFSNVINGIVHNVRLTGSTIIIGGDKVGGLIGELDKGFVDNCQSSLTVKATGENATAGGLIGSVGSNNSLITHSASTGNTETTQEGGGLIGYSEGAVRNSYTRQGSLTLTGNSGVLGGLVGWHVGDSIRHSYSAHLLSQGREYSGLAGYSGALSQQSFFDCEAGGVIGDDGDCLDFNNGIIGATTQQMLSASTFTDWASSPNIWGNISWQLVDGHYPELIQHQQHNYFVRPLNPEQWQRELDSQPLDITPGENQVIHLKLRAVISGSNHVDYQLRSDVSDGLTITKLDSLYGVQRWQVAVAPEVTLGTLFSLRPVAVGDNQVEIELPSFMVSATTSAKSPLADDQELSVCDSQKCTIDNLAELRWLSENPAAWHYDWYQTQDIDAAESRFWYGGQGFHPIGDGHDGMREQQPFRGRYFGQHHHVTNVYINRPNQDYVGLFGGVSNAAISNLGVTGQMVGLHDIGGLIGKISSNVNVTGCYADVEVTATAESYSYAGGLVGSFYYDSFIDNSYAKGDVTASSYAGSLVGRASDQDDNGITSTITNSYATGNAISNGKPRHGLLGSNAELVIIRNSFFDCESNDAEQDHSDCGLSANDGSMGLTTAQMQQPNQFIDAGWGSASPWQRAPWQLQVGHYPALAETAIAPTFVLPEQPDWDDIQITEDMPHVIQLSANGYHPESELSFTLRNAPSWATINADNQLVLAPFHDDHAGNHPNLQVVLTEQSAADHKQTLLPAITIAVTANEDQPVAANPVFKVNEDQRWSLDLNTLVSGSTQPRPLNFKLIGEVPSGLTLTGSVASYQPAPNWFGEVKFHYQVDDELPATRSRDSGTVTLVYLSVNDRPSANNGELTTQEDTAAAVDLAQWVTDIDSPALSFEILQPPQNGQAELQGSSLNYRPNDNFNGTDSLQYRVSDGELSASATLTITVIAVNDAPVAIPATITVNEDGVSLPLNLNNLAQDVDNQLRFTVTSAANGTAVLLGTAVVYTPAPNFNGVDRFSYTAAEIDGALTATADITVMVTAINDKPTITGTPETQLKVNELYRFTPIASDADNPNDTLTFAINNKPSWSTFNPTSGELSGTPTLDDVGTHKGITISVHDAADAKASLPSFNIKVIGELQLEDDVYHFEANSSERYLLDVLANDQASEQTIRLTSAFAQSGIATVVGNQVQLDLAQQPANQLTVTYTASSADGQTDSAIALVTIKRSSDIQFSELPPLSHNASGLLTLVSLDAPIATDGDGNEVPVQLVNPASAYPPGTHEILWQAEDAAGLTALTSQWLHMMPQVSLPIADTVGALVTEYPITVSVNGPLPAGVALEVPFSVFLDGQFIEQGSVVIENGQRAAVIPLTGLMPDSQYQVTLNDDGELNIGVNPEFRLTVSAAEFLQPQLTHQLMQDGESRQQIARDGGAVLLNLRVTNADADDRFLFNNDNTGYWQPLEQPSSQPAEVVFQFDDVASLPLGKQQHRIVVQHQLDDLGEKATEHIIYFDVVETLTPLAADADSDGDGIPDAIEGHQDSDGDGIADYLDAINATNVVPSTLRDQHRFLVETEPGLTLTVGRTAAIDPSHTSGGLLVSPTALPGDNEQTQYVGGIFDFSVTGAQPGAMITLVLPQQAPIPAGASYRKLQQGEWRDLVLDQDGVDHGVISSAKGSKGICPAPGPVNRDRSPWRLGLNQGDWCVQLSILDGGLNDDDKLANGTVVDPGGVALVSSNQAPQLQNDAFNFVVGTAELTLDVLGNDSDDKGQLRITEATTTRGSVSFSEEVLWFTPPINELGEFHLSYIATDSDGVAATAEVTVTITEPAPAKESGQLGWWLLPLLTLLLARQRVKPH